jgi:hypothetical protein
MHQLLYNRAWGGSLAASSSRINILPANGKSMKNLNLAVESFNEDYS